MYRNGLQTLIQGCILKSRKLTLTHVYLLTQVGITNNRGFPCSRDSNYT